MVRMSRLCHAVANVLCASSNGAGAPSNSIERSKALRAGKVGRLVACVSMPIRPCGSLHPIYVFVLSLRLCAEMQTDKDAEKFEVSWACQVMDADMPACVQCVCVFALVHKWFKKEWFLRELKQESCQVSNNATIFEGSNEVGQDVEGFFPQREFVAFPSRPLNLEVKMRLW